MNGNAIAFLLNTQELSSDEARMLMHRIGVGEYTPVQTAALLGILATRPVALCELRGFRQGLLDLCLSIDLSEFNPMDMCGTGGDGKNTINLSTLAAFVVAGAGVPVAKHGNYSVSSPCGSSNVMEELGYRFTVNRDVLRRQLDRAGLCFLHAPLFHPAMKVVAPVRRELGIKTVFNMLGPLVNPARPTRQLAGVFSLELARMYTYVLQQTAERFAVVRSLDGYDEVSLTGACKLITHEGEQTVLPSDFGVEAVQPVAIAGGRAVRENTALFLSVLQGKGTPAQSNAVVANAATALWSGGCTASLADGVACARESLETGKAYRVLTTLLELSTS